MSIPDFGTPYEMRNALERMVRHAGQRSIDRVPRWSHVGKITGHGSGYSAAICLEFGQDPDEIVGGLIDDKYCPACRKCMDCGCHDEVECDEDCEE